MQNTQNLIKNYNIKLSHIEVAASNWGDANGKPIIALHGWLDNMASFYPLLKDTRWLKDNNLLLITVDWPGHDILTIDLRGSSIICLNMFKISTI